MKSMEDRMEGKLKKFKKIIKNAATSGNNDGKSLGRRAESDSIGNSFACAALKILQTLSEEDRNRYSALTAALELRFGDEHLKQGNNPRKNKNPESWRISSRI